MTLGVNPSRDEERAKSSWVAGRFEGEQLLPVQSSQFEDVPRPQRRLYLTTVIGTSARPPQARTT